MAAAAAVDAFAERQLLMGEASEPAYEELARRARRIFDDHSRLFVFWRSRTNAECHAVGPSTRCFCTHSYSSHAWYETASKRIRCRVEGCGCECFAYVPGRGSSHLRCACKHTHHEHRTAGGRAGPCRACAPGGCAGFHSDWRCGCGETYDAHRTVFETAAERAKDGRGSASNLGGWGRERPHLDAACGGLTGMTSLAPDAALFRRFDAQAEALAARRAAMRGGVPPRGAPPPPRATRGPSLAQRRGVLAAAAERRAGEAAPLLLCGDDGRGAEGPPACSRTSRAQGFARVEPTCCSSYPLWSERQGPTRDNSDFQT
ncbi:hypothetical protein AB1Y20_001552 [Prymnesium parvum]|uniref:Protein FAM221A n=1 Tax=Prymnesium parvum TaxID=97485 RepID=A0AB34KBF3_PRYPA